MDRTEENLRRIRAYNKRICDTGEWVEEDHPRSKNGQFTSGAGESKSSEKENPLEKLAAATQPQEKEEEKTANKKSEYKVDKAKIASHDYYRKFHGVDATPNVKKKLHKLALDILNHRDGTYYEDMYLINRYTGESDAWQDKMDTWGNSEESRFQSIEYNDQMYAAIDEHDPYTYVTIHNHPGSSPPSGDDLEAASKYKYHYGITICHDGTVWGYQVKDAITAYYFNSQVADSYNKIYNEELKKPIEKRKSKEQCQLEAYEKAFEDCEKQYGLRWWKA